MEKVSVFGGKGFVGGHFCNANTDRVEVVEREAVGAKYPVILDFVSTIDNYNVRTNPYLDIETNLTLLIRKLEDARKTHGINTVYNLISTWFVYGKTRLPAREDAPCNPTGFYSITKRAAEQLLISYCQTFGMSWRVLRLGNVIGIGDKKISPRKNALQYMIRELAQGREVSLYKSNTIRDFINVCDVVEAIRLVLNKGEPNQIYNVANGRGWNVQQLVEYAHAIAGTGKINIVPVPEFHKQVQTMAMRLDISKLKKLGYTQSHGIEETVVSLVQYYRNNEKPNP